MLTERENRTREIYDNRPYEWLEKSGGRDRCFWSKEMSLFIEHLGLEKTVLELGCGPATDGKHLLNAGCRQVVSVDYSMGMLKMSGDVLREAPRKPDLSQMNVYDLGFPEKSFDGVWASAVFVHLANPKEVLSQINRVLKPEGYGLISVKEGEGERIDDKTGYYFHDFPVDGPDSLPVTLKESGFSVIDAGVREYPGRNWLTYLVQKT